MAPPALRWTLRHIKPEKQELERLKREELEEHSLIAGVRRVLIPVRCREEERRSILHLESHLVARMVERGPVAVTLLTVIEACDRELSERFLDRAAERFPGVELTRRVVEGRDVGEAVLDEAAKDYDLMILGAPGSDRKEEVFDPMVDYLVRMAPCPTLVTQGRVSERHWPPQRIIVPTNGSAASRNAADVAFNLAGEGDAEVTVLNVVSRSDASRRLDESGEVHRRQLAAARAIVDELCKVGEAMGVRTHTCVREGVAPEAALLELAAKEEADLILLGTDLRPGSERLFLGPRVERILNSAPCPVVVVNGG
jgi:nucleotide-binding universal stress UspA family protein